MANDDARSGPHVYPAFFSSEGEVDVLRSGEVGTGTQILVKGSDQSEYIAANSEIRSAPVKSRGRAKVVFSWLVQAFDCASRRAGAQPTES